MLCLGRKFLTRLQETPLNRQFYGLCPRPRRARTYCRRLLLGLAVAVKVTHPSQRLCRAIYVLRPLSVRRTSFYNGSKRKFNRMEPVRENLICTGF